MFDTDAFQTLENKGTQSRTPKEHATQEAQQQGHKMNRMYPLNAVPGYTSSEQKHQSYNTYTSARNAHPQYMTQRTFVPPHQVQHLIR